MKIPKFIPKYCPMILLPLWWVVWILVVILEFVFHPAYWPNNHLFRNMKIRKREDYEKD